MVLCVEQEYSLFEQNVNPMIAEKLTGERSRDYMMARRVAKENPAALYPLYKSGAARAPLAAQPFSTMHALVRPRPTFL
jgi:cleavage stimulation factor subunit 3